jgi:DHA1 family bicyclomycin/chloramphenicol resistance-like MFS transporter
MFLFAIVFSLLVGISEVDLIVPSFPELQKVFGLSAFEVELALSLNLLAHCILALFAGNLGDRFGHKRVILYGFSIFVLGSLLGAVANDFTFVLIGRMLQGAGVAPAIVLSYIIAMDKYPVAEHGRIMGMLNGVVAVSLSAAPIVGSYVSLYYGYIGNFFLMMVSGILGLIILMLFIPKDKKSYASPPMHLGAYWAILKNGTTLLFVLFTSLLIASYYTFVGTASILFIDGLQVPLADFGLYMMMATLTYGVFSILSGRLIQRIGKKNAFKLSVALLLTFVASSFYLMLSPVQPPALILLSSLFFILGMVIPVNEMFVSALNSLPQAKGQVSALISTLKWVFTIAGVQISSFFYQGNYLPIGLTIIMMILTCLILLYVIAYRNPSFKDTLQET